MARRSALSPDTPQTLPQTKLGALPYEMQRYALHRAMGKSPKEAAKIVSLETESNCTLNRRDGDPLIVDAIREVQVQLTQTVGVDAEWVLREMLKQYGKADYEGDRTNARLMLKEIYGVVDHRKQQRDADEIRNQTEWDGLSDERKRDELERYVRVIAESQGARLVFSEGSPDGVHEDGDAQVQKYEAPSTNR